MGFAALNPCYETRPGTFRFLKPGKYKECPDFFWIYEFYPSIIKCIIYKAAQRGSMYNTLLLRYFVYLMLGNNKVASRPSANSGQLCPESSYRRAARLNCRGGNGTGTI